MSSFFNKYNQPGNAVFSHLSAIPGTTDLFAFGSKGDRGLIVRFDQDGRVVWERLYEVPRSSCYFVQGRPLQNKGEGFMVLGGIRTNTPNRVHHLLVKISLEGTIFFSREIFNNATRSSLRLVPLPHGEFLISGWNSYGPDRIGIERIGTGGNSIYSLFCHFGKDEQMYDCIRMGNQLLFAGGTDAASRWDGFLIRTDVNFHTKAGHLVHFPDSNLVDEVDAITPFGENSFILAGHHSNDIYVTDGRYEGVNLVLGPTRFAFLNRNCKVRKMLGAGSFAFVLAYDTATLRHFVVKYDLAQSNPNLAKVWVKSFASDTPCYLTDIIPGSDGFYLSGFLRDPKKNNLDTPILIRTNYELDCCLTEEIPSGASDVKPVQLSVKVIPPVIGDAGSVNQVVPLSLGENLSSPEPLCPTGPVKGECPLAFTAWNALEPRARTRNFDRALQAEIRDAAWMLSRQWQWGEFNGEDGGSIVYSKLSLRTTRINRYTQLVKNPANKPYNNDAPLEYLVERNDVDIRNDWMLRLEAGNYWMKLLQNKFDADRTTFLHYKQGFINAYPFNLPAEPDPQLDQNDYIQYVQLMTNDALWPAMNATRGRAADGSRLLGAIHDGTIFNHGFVNPVHHTLLQEVKQDFLNKYLKNYSDDNGSDPAWSENNLEHQFQCRAPHPSTGSLKVKLVGREYPGEQLDWFNVDVRIDAVADIDDPTQTFNEAVTKNEVRVRIPSKLNFPGMPHPRWWRMEDHQIDFGNMLVNTTDISKLLLLDFMLNGAENWYIVPHQAEIGSLTEIEGIEVKDNFGIRTLINAANKVDAAGGSTFRKWGVFQLEKEPGALPPDSFLFLAPVIPNILESKPVEKVNFIRDETANMVWAIEQIIPNELTGGQDGQEASIALRNFLEKQKEEIQNTNGNDPDQPMPIKFQLATTVPENWIPFIPVHTPASHRSIQLQRATMPRTVADFTNNIIPRTRLLNEHPAPYFIHEEEVPKTGQTVTSTWQRARWFGGKTLVWYGHKKQVGRGGGTSGLKFDQLKYSEK